MENIEIIRWLRDKADRADSLSWTRMMHTAADRIAILEKKLESANKRIAELEEQNGR